MSKIKLTGSDSPVQIEPGIYRGVPFADYLRWDAFSKSMMGAALKSGRHLEYRLRNNYSSESMRFGSLVDTLILEPGEYNNRFAVRPETYTKEITRGRGANKVTTTEEKPFNSNSHTCKQIIKDLEESGKTVIGEDQLHRAHEVVASVVQNERASYILDACETQVSIVWIDPHTGIKCKGRLDLYDNKNKEIWDLKTTVDASPAEFARLLTRYNYHSQGGAYCMGMKILTGESHSFGIIAAETGGTTTSPQTALYQLDDESLMAGYAKLHRALKRVSVWSESGFEGYSRFVEPIGALGWEVERELAQWEGGELEL